MILKQRYERPFTDLAADFENIIEHVFGDGSSVTANWTPRANVFETGTSYRLEIELPGVDPDGVNVELTEGSLVVAGEKTIASDTEGQTVLKSERQTGTFNRTFKFVTQLDADKISANFKHGILTVHLPKSEKELPKKIKVNIAE